jgi:hypothetical protein
MQIVSQVQVTSLVTSKKKCMDAADDEAFLGKWFQLKR